MASIAKRPNGKYRARFRDPEGHEHSRHFDRRKDATEWLSDQIVKVTEGTWTDPRRGRRTFGEYVEEWRAAQIHLRASTLRNTDQQLRRCLAQFEDRPLSQITRTEVQSWVSSLKLAPATVEGTYRLFARIMRAAVEDHRIPSSPCRKIRLPAKAARLVIPTVEQVQAIAAAAGESGAFVLLAAGSGLRSMELTGVTVDRVDWLRGVITVDRQVNRRAEDGLFSEPKTKAAVRKVPIPRDLVAVLSAYLVEHPSDGLLFTKDGQPWRQTDKDWRAWCVTAGVTGVRLHDLRHFYASMLIGAGQSVKVVQERLGHASAQTTLDLYSHLWPADEDATREAVAGALGDALRTARGPR